ncbi:hypothetical protein [Nevskia ramosa]|uniref:hypothetical protein n=1 Tax=Nevskia ramosa TaxID=64002 RepID=UPI003D151E32
MGQMEQLDPAIKLEIARPETAALAAGDTYIATAESLVIDCADMLEFAQITLVDIKTQANALETRRKEGKAPILRAGENWDAMFKPAIDTLARAEAVIKPKVAAFIRDQQRIAAEQQRIADEAAAKERKRLAAEAEETRKQAALEAAASRAAAAQAECPATAAALNDQAAEVEAEAEASASATVMAAAMTVAAVVQPAAVAPKGTTITTVWHAEGIENQLMATIQAVAAGDVPMAVLCFNDKEISRLAKSLKSEMKYPGIRVWSEDQVGIRTKGVR